MQLSSLQNGSDIRGVAMGPQANLTAKEVDTLSRAFALWLAGRTQRTAPRIAVGMDARLSGPALKEACIAALADCGLFVLDCGMASTPAMFMTTVSAQTHCDGAVMLTASHLPSDRNGMKFFTCQGGLESGEIAALLRLSEGDLPSGRAGQVQTFDFISIYAEGLRQKIQQETGQAQPLKGLKILVDAGNGAGGFYAEKVLQPLGADIQGSQFLEPDGHFPHHIPNPENEQAMAAISQAVVKVGADLGVIFDADCDRAAIVDAAGREINRNRLIALISAILLDKEPGATIVTDSVTSSGLAQFITEWGGVHYRYKRGYRNVIDEAVRLNAAGIDCPLAIETSGHAALRENHFLDDGMYLVTVLIVEAMRLKQEGKELSSLLDGLREPVESVELRLNITAPDFREAGRTVIERVMDHASYETDWHIAPDNREGVRINFDLDDGLQNGWFLLRLSVHDPVLPLNVESDVPGGVRTMLSKLLSVLDGIEDIDISPIRAYLSKQ